MSPMCNGAGEMPGQEGRDSESENYNEWIEANENEIIEAYKESIEIDDIPDEFIQTRYSNAKE